MREPSAARRGLDWLLSTHRTFEVVSVEWQEDGPWLLVTLGVQSDNPEAWVRYPWAVWRETGAVYGVHNGAVSDNPVHVP